MDRQKQNPCNTHVHLGSVGAASQRPGSRACSGCWCRPRAERPGGEGWKRNTARHNRSVAVDLTIIKSHGRGNDMSNKDNNTLHSNQHVSNRREPKQHIIQIQRHFSIEAMLSIQACQIRRWIYIWLIFDTFLNTHLKHNSSPRARRVFVLCTSAVGRPWGSSSGCQVCWAPDHVRECNTSVCENEFIIMLEPLPFQYGNRNCSQPSASVPWKPNFPRALIPHELFWCRRRYVYSFDGAIRRLAVHQTSTVLQYHSSWFVKVLQT